MHAGQAHAVESREQPAACPCWFCVGDLATVGISQAEKVIGLSRLLLEILRGCGQAAFDDSRLADPVFCVRLTSALETPARAISRVISLMLSNRPCHDIADVMYDPAGTIVSTFQKSSRSNMPAMDEMIV